MALQAVHCLEPVHPRLQVVIAGEGHDRSRLQRMARRLGFESCVRFLGMVDHERVPDLLAGSDLLVMPSMLGEGGR